MYYNPDKLMTQSRLADHLGVGVTTVANWIKRRDKTDFPEEKERIGRFKFYDVDEVDYWYKLWSQATANMGNKELNGGKRTSS